MQLRIGFGGIRIHHVNNGFLSVNIKTGCRGCEECENVIPPRGIARTTTILSTTLSLDTAFTHDNSSSANFLPP
jgi:hypothetical protein